MFDNEGYIEVTKINKVLTYENGKVGFEARESPIPGKQKWILGPKETGGWHTIKHSITKKFLTTSYIHPSSHLSIEDKGRLHFSKTLYKG